jgi:hypothetical protein
MSALTRPFFPLLATSALLLIPSTSIGESVLAHQDKASAALDFRIIIPPVLRVLENSHPLQLDSFADGGVSAQQRLVVVSNMKRGFCVSLRRAAAQPGTWEVQTAPQNGMQFSPVANGYRLCGTRPGRYTVLLQHRFGASGSSTNALNWPVQTDISAI